MTRVFSLNEGRDRTWRRAIAVCVSVAALAAGPVGCGDDSADKAAESARQKASQAAESARQKASQAAESARQKASAAATRVLGGRALVVMSDYKFTPASLAADAGELEVVARNVGDAEHEFVLLRTDRAPDAIPVKGGVASEDGAVGEIPEQTPGETGRRTFTVKPGRYVFLCNVEGHYERGMRGALVVE